MDTIRKDGSFMHDLVKYSNYLNSVSLGTFKADELNLFMAICSKVRDKGIEEQSYTFAEIRNLANLANCDSRESFISALRCLNRKLVSAVGHYEDDDVIEDFPLFTKLKADKAQNMFYVRVNPDYAFVLNDLSANFTKFELEEFCHLSSKHSKNLYRLLKQYDNRQSGWFKVTVSDLRDKLGCPKSYSNPTFIRDIVKPSVIELEKIFIGLTCDVDRARLKGRPITGFEFRWRPCVNDDMPGQIELKDICPTEVIKYTDENGKTQFRMKKKKSPDFEQRTYDFDELEKQILENN